ncbi:MAG TPA: hypothetical protein VFK94_02920 [Patescibacteria group bacterium]|nr:hypothetical protein [Patescibacteria group bacterium]
MDKKFLKHLEDQFGGYFSCTCQAPFDRSRFEVVKESDSSLVAHYTCARCGREHVLFYGLGAAVAASIQTDMEAHEVKRFLSSAPITADDVLEVRDYFKKFKGNFRTVFKPRLQPETGNPGNYLSLNS